MNIVFGILILVAIIVVIAVVGIFLVTGLTGAPYVPTLKDKLPKAFTELYKMSEKDLLIDLGSGDGCILNEASRTGAKCLGIEINPILALMASWRFYKNKKIKIKCRNFYTFQFPAETTVIYAFAESLHIRSIYRKIQAEANRLDKTLYFISNAFDVPEVKEHKKVDSFYLYKIEPKD
ncbi:hypothetical protein IJI91_01495 [Candidatus Saccharibacteria bacterium]|nr:hypothetical protein [Candidatus Saccharibacteria bacterium]MBR0460648.1 hypothetical protein [Candidatus Saccharibacteria bacterium]